MNSRANLPERHWSADCDPVPEDNDARRTAEFLRLLEQTRRLREQARHTRARTRQVIASMERICETVRAFRAGTAGT